MSRPGYSLTELLVVMGMTSVILTAGVGMVHRVMHEQRFADRDNAMHRVAERLSTRLREDVHAADDAELIQSGDEHEQRLVLNQPGERTVTYIVHDNALERTSTRENELAHRDSFQFPDNFRLQFFDVAAERVTFTLYAHPQAYLSTTDKPPRAEIESGIRRAVMHVEARVGRDLRFLRGTRKPSAL